MARSSAFATLVVTTLVSSVLVASPAGAAAPTYERGDTIAWNCTLDDDPLVEFRGSIDPVTGSSVGIFVQLDDGFLAPDWEAIPDLTVTADAISGTVPMVRVVYGEEPTPAGTATIDVSASPAGERERIRENGGGNTNVRFGTVGFTQPMSLAGFVTVNGETYSDLSGCPAQHSVFTTRTTNPDTLVNGITGGDTYDASCMIGDAEGYLELIRDGQESTGYFVTFDEESHLSGSIVEARWHPGQLGGTYTLEEGGSGTATAYVDQGALLGETELLDTLGPFRRTYSIEMYDAAGRLLLSDGTSRDLTCVLGISTGMSVLHSPSGPQLANDAPADAVPLPSGDRVEVRTGRAHRTAELGTECAQSQFAYTVWYWVEGEGQPASLDTRDSDFDTVVAVYAEWDGELVEVACGNDDDDRFATVSWLAEDEVRYLVQVGGADGQSGRLVLTRPE